MQLSGKSWAVVILAGCVYLAGCSERETADEDSNSGEAPSPTVDLSGVINIEARTRVDSDTADDFLAGAAQSNNSDPQALISPVLIGGYLSSGSGTYNPANTPENANFEFFTDSADRFELRLTENQVVSLRAFRSDDAPSPDGDSFGQLALLQDGMAVDSDSISPRGTALVSPPENAQASQYTVLVESTQNSGPFRYVMSATAGGGATGAVSFGEPAFVPGEAIITMEPQSGTSQPSVSALGNARAASMGHGVWHVKQADARALSAMTGDEKQTALNETLAWIRKLRTNPDVRSAEPNYLVHAFAVNASNDPLFRLQWHYPLIGLPTAWQVLADPGQGIRIAVLDTGVFSRSPEDGGDWHPDLDDGSGEGSNIAVISPIADFVSGEQDNDGDSGRDGNPADPGMGSPQTDSFHGSHVAGTIAALDNNVGGVGVAPLATVLPIRVLGEEGVGTSNDLIAAINALASLPENERPDIINLSLGLTVPVEPLEAAIQRAVDAGSIVVAAAGNQGTSDRTYPAAYSNVIAVGAVDAGREPAGYSNFGNWLQLVAPGGDASRDGNNDGQGDVVTSLWGIISNGDYEPAYAGIQGTSMAAPHVSGVIALMKQQRESLDHDEFLGFLRQGDLTDDVGRSINYGFGLVNAAKSVDAATDGRLDSLLLPTPASLQFEGSVFTTNLELTPFPEENNEIDLNSVSVQSAPPWLDVMLEPSTGNGRTLTATINNEEAAEQAKVVLEYGNDAGGQTLDLPVNVLLGDMPGNRNAGRHFVLLLGAGSSRDTIAQVNAQPVNGQYAFAFDDVPAGDYFLVAGSDVDNNGFICEAAEACAEYPTTGFPQPITVGNQPITGLSVTTSFQRPALESQSLPRVGFEGYRVLGNSARVRSSSARKSVTP